MESILETGFILSHLDHLLHCSASEQGAWECKGAHFGFRDLFCKKKIFAIQAQHYCEVHARIVLALFKTAIRI